LKYPFQLNIILIGHPAFFLLKNLSTKIEEEANMKRLLAVVLALGLILVSVPVVLAGGDNNRGEIGQGSTNENACPNQPCFADAPQPGPTVSTDQNSGLVESELNQLTGMITGHN
jgi:hypothetical protein